MGCAGGAEVDPKRIALVAADLVAHFEKRLDAMDGKAMIVCMSRRICMDMYDALIVLRPDWASARDTGMLISTETPALCGYDLAAKDYP